MSQTEVPTYHLVQGSWSLKQARESPGQGWGGSPARPPRAPSCLEGGHIHSNSKQHRTGRGRGEKPLRATAPFWPHQGKRSSAGSPKLGSPWRRQVQLDSFLLHSHTKGLLFFAEPLGLAKTGLWERGVGSVPPRRPLEDRRKTDGRQLRPQQSSAGQGWDEGDRPADAAGQQLQQGPVLSSRAGTREKSRRLTLCVCVCVEKSGSSVSDP